MANIYRVLSLSSLILLAYALPAADLVDNNSACLSSWHAYDSSRSGWNEGEHPTTSVIATKVGEPAFDFNVPYTTLCDGYRRAVVSRTTTQTVTYDPPMTTTFNQGYLGPAPTCTIGCAFLMAFPAVSASSNEA